MAKDYTILSDASDTLQALVSESGSELQVLGRKSIDGKGVLWTGDPEYWNRHAPILFPSIGKSFGNQIKVDGTLYPMPKHGLALNMKWERVEKVRNEKGNHRLVMQLTDTPETLQHYPFHFALRQIFQVESDAKLSVTWEVESREAEGTMPFSVGAHPAFLIPGFNPNDEVHGYLQFDTPEIVSQEVLPDGHLHIEQTVIKLDEDHLLPLTNHTFDCDTLLDIRGLNREVTLLDKQRRPVVRLTHEMPVIAIWAPRGGQCPFVCIEPWYGVCDGPDYDGEFSDRPFMQHVKAGEVWSTTYTIELFP